jgi:diadenosine tetraphosphate (Ap4A) HIT family hydrolase
LSRPDECPLCTEDGGRVIFRSDRFRIIHAGEADFPAFYRLIWHAHVRELTDLSEAEQWQCWQVLATLERCLRQHVSPNKINLASLGNQVPHLHWHVIARFAWDSHFPASVWAAPMRPADSAQNRNLLSLLAALESDVVTQVQSLQAKNQSAV